MFVVASLVSAALLAGSAGATTSADPCEALVVDEAGVLSTTEVADLESQAAALRTDTSFEVRVRIVDAEQWPVLDLWADEMEQSCASWTSAGGFRPNLVVLALSTDADGNGESGLYYGDSMPAEMDDVWTEVLADEVNPQVVADEWAAGIGAGLDAVRSVLDPPVSPWVWVAVGVPVVGGAGWAGRAGWRRRSRRSELTDWFGRTTTALDELTLKLTPATESVRRDLELVRTAFHAEEIETALGSADEVLREAEQVIYRRSELAADRDQVLDGRDLDQVAEEVGQWDALEHQAESVLPTVVAEQERLAAELDRERVARSRLEQAAELVAGIEAAATGATAEGFVVTGDVAVLDAVGERRTEVVRLLDERRLRAADDESAALAADLTRARDLVTSVRQRRAELTEREQSLTAAQRDLEAAVTDGVEAERRLAAEFGDVPAVEASVATARDRTSQAGDLLSRAGQDLSSGDLASAAANLESVAAAQSEATDLVKAVQDRLSAGEQLRERLPERRTALAKRLGDTEELATRYAVSVPETYRTRLAQVRDQLSAVNLEATPMDWFAAGAALDAVETALDSVVATIQELRQAQDRRSYAASADEVEPEPEQTSGWGWLGSGASTRGSRGWSRRRSWGSSGGGSSRRSFRSSGSRRGGSLRRSGGSVRRSSGGRRGGSSRR